MRSRFDLKLGVFASLAALACAGSMGTLAYWAAEQGLRESLREQARVEASRLALRTADELKALAERARYYVSSSQPKAFEKDGDLLALTVLHSPASGFGDWVSRPPWLLPQEHPSRLSAADLEDFELKHPLDLERTRQGFTDAAFGTSRSSVAFLRLSIPYGPNSTDGYPQAIVAEVRMSRFQALFTHSDELFAFMTAAGGELAIASDSGHFGVAEDLSELPLVLEAREASAKQGSLDYRETPETELQYAAFARVASAPGLTVFAQAPHARLALWLEPLVEAMAAAGGVFALLVGLTSWWISRHWSWQLGKPGQLGQPGSPRQAREDSKPQEAAAALAKISDPKMRRAFEKGRINLSGERIDTAVLHAHLHGVDRLSSQADPERLLELLNDFHRRAAEAVESRHGIVDHMHGGSVVAFWGVPEPKNDDVRNAIEAATEISKAVQRLNEALRQDQHEPCRLGMGLHYGPLAAGEVGAPGRKEYSAVGEALEVASRIQQFADQFGTELLITAPAADRAGKAHPTEQLTAGDEQTPPLYELAG